jgi:hypothetical protein
MIHTWAVSGGRGCFGSGGGGGSYSSVHGVFLMGKALQSGF